MNKTLIGYRYCGFVWLDLEKTLSDDSSLNYAK